MSILPQLLFIHSLNHYSLISNILHLITISKISLCQVNDDLQITQLTNVSKSSSYLILSWILLPLLILFFPSLTLEGPPSPGSYLTSLTMHSQCQLLVCFPVSSPLEVDVPKDSFLAAFSL